MRVLKTVGAVAIWDVVFPPEGHVLLVDLLQSDIPEIRAVVQRVAAPRCDDAALDLGCDWRQVLARSRRAAVRPSLIFGQAPFEVVIADYRSRSGGTWPCVDRNRRASSNFSPFRGLLLEASLVVITSDTP